METLVEFVLGNGYYEDPKKFIFENMNIDRLKLDFDYLNICTHPSATGVHTRALYNEYFDDVELVWKIPHCVAPLTHANYIIKSKDLSNILKCVKKNSKAPFDFIRRFAIFVRVFSDNYCMTIARLVPAEITSCEFDSYDEISLRCYTYNMHRWFGDSCLISENSSDIWHQREIMLKSEMRISDTRYNELSRYGDDIMNFTPTYIHDATREFLCDIPDTIDGGMYRLADYICKLPAPIELKANAKAFGEMVSSLKDLYEYDFQEACKKVFSIELTNDLLSGGSNMNILDQLPKIKRLERNGAFTTAVWEDGTVTKLKKSDQDGDDFEKLIFFLVLKKLCDNNTHKMHSTLTDCLNTFRDATVDIPKQKEEKAEKKRKAKEEAEGNDNVGS